MLRVFRKAGGQGFEPRSVDPESTVLPLDDPPIKTVDRITASQPVSSIINACFSGTSSVRVYSNHDLLLIRAS